MSCLPHGHPRMWLGAEDSRIPGHHCWASRGGQPEDAERLGPSPRAQGLGLEIPVLAFSPPSASVRPVGDPGWSVPRLCVSLPYFTLHVLSVWAFSAPALPRPSALCHAFCFLELPHPHPMSFLIHLLFCPVSLTLFQPLFPLLHPPTLSCCKREKKGGRGSKHKKKPKQKLISSVLQSAASSWWPLCVPVACSLLAHPTRLPCVLPACPPCPSCRRHGFSAWVFGDGSRCVA